MAVAVLASTASCGAGAGLTVGDQRAISIETFADSGWTADNLAVVPATGSDPGELALVSSGSPAASVLLELHFDSSLVAEPSGWNPPAEALSIIVANQPGLLAIGIVMPEGQTLDAGQLLRLRLVHAGDARSASAAPQNKYGQVTDLAAASEGSGLRLNWSYRNDGDCDQNQEVNVSDLSAMAPRLKETTNDGDQDAQDEVLDVDGNTEINPSDLTGIGINYRGTVTNYNIYSSDNVDPTAATIILDITSVNFPLGSPNPKTRRQFTALLDAAQVGTGNFFFVRPQDNNVPNEGPISNVVPGVILQPAKIEIPPAGQQNPDTGNCLAPSVVMMPDQPGISQPGAPVIVYLSAGVLTLAYYNSVNGWVKEDISGGDSYNAPQAVFTGTEGLVLAYDSVGANMHLLRFDNAWVATTVEIAAVSGGGTFAQGAADYDPATGTLGMIHAYSTPNGAHVAHSQLAGGNWTSVDIYNGNGDAGEILGGVSFRFDPAGGQPWGVYTVGAVTGSFQNLNVTIDTSLNVGRFDGAGWSFSEVPYVDEPLTVDLGFAADNTPRIAMNAGRDYTLNTGLDQYTATILLDGVVGDFTGGNWAFQVKYTSNAAVGVIGGFPPSGYTLTLNLATDAALTGTTGAIFTINSGTLAFDTAFVPQGGSLTPGNEYYASSTPGTWNLNTSFFDGSPGTGFDWYPNGQAAAYLDAPAMDSSNLGTLNQQQARPLQYWTP